MGDSLLEERLAAATAIPPSQRSPEVVSFIECCNLQRELTDNQQLRNPTTHQQQSLAALKLTRSHILSPNAPLWYRPAVYQAALERVFSSKGPIELPVGGPGQCIMALVESDLTMETLLLVAAGVVAFGRGQAQQTGLLPAYNSIVERMQRPAVAARLLRELDQLQADLPRVLVSYDELLAHFVWLSGQEAGELLESQEMDDNSSSTDVRMALRTAAELLPKLVPGHLSFRFASIVAVGWYNSCTGPRPLSEMVQPVRLLRALLAQAQERNCDCAAALCAYQLAASAIPYSTWGYACQQLAWQRRQDPGSLAGEVLAPSAFLGWLQQARQPHARCQAILPMQWTVAVKCRQREALACKQWLLRLQREGDLWQQSGLDLGEALAKTVKLHEQLLNKDSPAPELHCSGCSNSFAHLQVCGGCKQAMYCSRACQRAHWSRHKIFCKAQQEGRRHGEVGRTA